MLRLLRLVHLPFWSRYPNQALLPALGIALGVAAIVAVDLGSGSTVSSFKRTLEQLEGRTTHQVIPGREKVPGEIAAELARIPGVEAAAPVLETIVLAGEPLRMLGIDPLAEAEVRNLGLGVAEDDAGAAGRFMEFIASPGALLVSAPFLRRSGLEPGDDIEIVVGARRVRAYVLDALPEQTGDVEIPDNLAFADLATAQELTGRVDVSRIDLVIPDGPQRAAALAAVSAALPSGIEIGSPGGSARSLETMMQALSMNLGALSYLALFVSLFLIYNTMLIAVLRRRPQLGIVRCLGATRGEVLGAWMIEAALIGVIGIALGLLIGLGAGRLALQGIARTATDLYGYVRGDTLALAPAIFIKASVVGMLAALAAALFPAAEAAATRPAHTSARSEVESQAARRFRRAPWLGVPLLAIGAASLLLPTGSPVPGYVAAVCLALAIGLIVPFLGAWTLARLEPFLEARVGVIAGMAARNIRSSLSRTGVALAALTIALSMSIGMATMVSSFRVELQDWIDNVVRADIYVTPAATLVDRTHARFDRELIELLRSRPGVRAVDSIRRLPARMAGVETFAAGVEIDVYRRAAQPRIIEGPDPETWFDRIQAGQAGVSETLMRKTGLRSGDRFTLEASGQEIELVVAGIYRDYSSDRGVVMLERGLFESSFGEQAPNGIALYLDPDRDVDAEVDALKRELAGDYALLLQSNRGLREQANIIFERTFSVARALEMIGITVAAIGILAALLAMLLERQRELATLRALGLTLSQLRRLLLGESLLLASLAWVFALAGGSALAWILLRVINLRSFGWMLPFHTPWWDWGLNLFWSLLAAGLAAWLPIVRSRRLPVASALREE